MPDPNDFNAGIIREFRENAGKVGGPFEGMSMLLLHSTGAKSGEERAGIWEPWKTAVPMFAEYEQKTDREIPVIVLEPRS